MTTISDIITSNCHESWEEDFQVIYHAHYDGDDIITITDGRNSFLNKAYCPKYQFTSTSFNGSKATINSKYGQMTPKQLVQLAETKEWKEDKWNNFSEQNLQDGFKITRYDLVAKETYNPNQLQRIKPLKKAPKKWTLPMAIRAMVNGQVKATCDGNYSDDYAFDAATNYGKGNVNCGSLAKKIIKHKSGWMSYLDTKGIVAVSCHHFENYSLTITDKAII